MNPINKTVWTPEMIAILKGNYLKMTNQELANRLGLKLTNTRSKLYSLGLLKMELQYWTPKQVKFLKENYKRMGDSEIAEIFTATWEKKKGWTKKAYRKEEAAIKLKKDIYRKKCHS